ncbi:MAG: cation-transporting P-type ATPase [Nanoarchaeota archaeon]|nr:cation-transporting P-type ATPase [Nanoarchaeota archaeon]
MTNIKSGLKGSEAERKLRQYGPNEIKDVAKVYPISILLRQIKNNFIIYLLLSAMLISFFVGKSVTAYVIFAIIILIITTGFVQEYKAENAIKKLKSMTVPISIVIRDGKEQEIATNQIVPGDVLKLRTGERIPADCVILSNRDLLVNEAILTGEVAEIKKTSVKNIKSPKEENLLFTGTFIISGKCTAKALHTGMNTRFGKIAKMISTAEKELPLQKKINKMAKYMALIGIIMSFLTGLIILMQTPFSNELAIEILILSIAIAVAAFPEGFPVVLITSLSVGSYRMAKKNAIVNRMSIIETLGETTVICSDKTGTITKGEMTVRKIFTDNKIYELTGVGYEGNGNFLLNNKKIDATTDKSLNILLKTAVLCNDSKITRTGENRNFNIIGAPTEAALLVMSSKANMFVEDFNAEIIEEIPFSSERKMMSVLIKENKTNIIYSKGAIEILLKKCKYIQRNSGISVLSEKDKNAILKENTKLTSNAFRTLALAYKKTESTKKEDMENDMVFVGFVAIDDPPRNGVKDAIMTCKRAGIKIKMITGDHKETAIAIAKQIGLNSKEVLEGHELDKITDDELRKIIKNITIFVRVRPEHKLRIVKALKDNGEIVTMTGDGVNDAPALKEAHIGVAMGKNGTDVSRSVADLTLKDDNFVTLVDAIREGRTIFNNIRKFASYQLSCNYSELLILFIGVLLVPLLGWPIPILLALQILFMNIVTDNLPAITLGLNRSSVDIMNEKPRKGAEILTKDLLILLIGAGTLMTIFTLATFYFTFNVLGQSEIYARTTALLALIVLEIAGAFSFRSFRKMTLTRSPLINPYLVYASAISVAATIAIIYTPLNKLFETVPLPAISWIIVMTFAFIFTLIFDIFKKINFKRKILDLN